MDGYSFQHIVQMIKHDPVFDKTQTNPRTLYLYSYIMHYISLDMMVVQLVILKLLLNGVFQKDMFKLPLHAW